MFEPLKPTREVAQRSTVDVTGATEALVVGPHDILVVMYPETVEMDELCLIRDAMRDTDLRDGQVVLLAGATKMVKVAREDADANADRPQWFVGDAASRKDGE